MGAVGLFYVGAVLVINGVMLLGRISPQGAAPLNFFVGALQVVTPTVMIIQSGGDADVIFGASGLYLFGFTYLWVAINAVVGWDGAGLGWFSLFVAIAALGYSWHSFTAENDAPFGVIWLLWAVLWFLFFLVLGRGRESLASATGVVALVEGFLTAAVPGFLILSDLWSTGATAAVVIGVIGAAALVFAIPLARLLAVAPLTTSPAGSTATS
jgi:hypothetical protein